MSFYRSNVKRNANMNDGQTGDKRKKARWTNRSKGREPEVSFNSDTLFKEPYPPNRSPNARNNYGFNDEMYDRRLYDNYNRDLRSSPGSSPRSNPRPNVRQRNYSEAMYENFVEPEHAGPAWQWEKYFHECNNWQSKHKLAYYKSRCMALEFENQMLFEQIKTLIHENGIFAAEQGELPSMLLPNFPGGLKGFEENEEATAFVARNAKNKGKAKKVAEVPDDNVCEVPDESLVCEVPDEMIRVMEKSMRHKIKLFKDRKAEKEEKTNEDNKKVKEDAPKSAAGPKEPRGLKRKEELGQLFGESATLIQNLETSIQHNFNRFCDTYKPEMYPAVALNSEVVA